VSWLSRLFGGGGRRSAMKVKAKANFEYHDVDTGEKRQATEGEIIELDRAELAHNLNINRVTKDLSWTPEDRGGQ
jgi:hypothetical protein